LGHPMDLVPLVYSLLTVLEYIQVPSFQHDKYN
jgi:hypothetical protein